MPPAARRGDPGVPHCSAYVIAEGSPNVYTNGRPAARVGDVATPHLKPSGRRCVVHVPPIVQGSSSVFINGRPAARQFDPLAACTVIALGSPNVIIGG